MGCHWWSTGVRMTTLTLGVQSGEFIFKRSDWGKSHAVEILLRCVLRSLMSEAHANDTNVKSILLQLQC